MEVKKMLLLGCSGMATEPTELKNITAQCNLYNYSSRIKIAGNFDDLKDILDNSKDLDFIYLSAHGNEHGFASESGELDITWMKFAKLLQDSHCLKEDAFLLLSCCRGGLNNVAYDLLYFCSEIQYICGPKISLTTQETLMGFTLFLFNVAFRNMDPVVACHKIMNSTDLRFMCFDRLEVITEAAYLMRKDEYDIQFIDENNDGIKDEIVILRRDINVRPRTDEEAEELLDE